MEGIPSNWSISFECKSQNVEKTPAWRISTCCSSTWPRDGIKQQSVQFVLFSNTVFFALLSRKTWLLPVLFGILIPCTDKQHFCLSSFTPSAVVFSYIVPTRTPSFLMWVWPTRTDDQTRNEAETSLVCSRKVKRVQNRISPDFSSRSTVVLGCWFRMGNLFGRKKQTRVTEQDKAILVSSTAS